MEVHFEKYAVVIGSVASAQNATSPSSTSSSPAAAKTRRTCLFSDATIAEVGYRICGLSVVSAGVERKKRCKEARGAASDALLIGKTTLFRTEHHVQRNEAHLGQITRFAKIIEANTVLAQTVATGERNTLAWTRVMVHPF